MADCLMNHFLSPAQRTRYAGAIAHRYSCRTYAAPPTPALLTALNYAAARVCLPGIRILIGDCPAEMFFGLPIVGGITGTTKCAYILADASMERPLLYAGISGEAFILEATAMGVGTCWVQGSYRKKHARVSLCEGERLVAVTPLGLAPEHAQPPRRRRKSLTQLCLSDPAAWPLWAYRAAEAVRQAPSALNLQPWQLSYGQNALRLMAHRVNTLDIGIAMVHMDAQAGQQCQWHWGEGRCVAHLIARDTSVSTAPVTDAAPALR